MSLEWNVFIERNNKIEIYNIFNHGSFAKYLKEIKKETDFETFSEKARRELSYYFRSKCEWEVIITNFPTTIVNEDRGKYRSCVSLEVEEKVDVYSQVMLNWNSFIKYLWENKKEL